MKPIRTIFVLLCVMLCSCKKNPGLTDRFPHEISLSEIGYSIDPEELALVEGIQCNDSSLIIFDYHSGKSFTLLDLETGRYRGRFGQIGQGPGEISLGCYGIVEQNMFHIFFHPTGLLAKYDMDSLRHNIDFRPSVLTKYDIPDAAFSQIHPISDSIFLGAGVCHSEYQYTLFDKRNSILNAGIEIYNARYFNFNTPNKFLSNQGRLRKHPGSNRFVYTLNYSANIDFFEVTDGNRIEAINLLRQGNPRYNPVQNGKMSMVVPDLNSSFGYIDVSVSTDYVYALYTDRKVTEPCSSDIVLIYDWQGNPVKKYRLNREAYYITTNEKLNRLFAAVKNEDGGWDITSYEMK
ncbi:MAG: TolB-like 6-bladed beta-propeller domain-containing protein [Tannerella sp.]|jgi:hypothetical protein|nr:TolB-like 6-bladed beta-propeller domain-containing protein [Tannerella sp.]